VAQALEEELKMKRMTLTLLLACGFTLSTLAAEPAPTPSGEAVYKRWCTHCHSAGRGNPGTESLQVKYGGKLPAVLLDRTDLSPQVVATFVRTGVLSMPPFRKTEVTDAELKVVAAYVAQKYAQP
jgi:mono/diheme cytochrome c family protein